MNNTRLACNLLALALGMLLLAYASVPLYRLFCQVTGYGGTTQVGTHAPAKATNRKITVEFNADTDPGLPWMFKPGEQKLTTLVGKSTLTHYVAENLSKAPVSGRAIYNVVPFKAGPYFVKVECFCFTEQTLAGSQKVDMPISFYIDPAMLDDPEMNDVKTITLSYTFFPLKTEAISKP